jgi:CheY-like chemotaxis protein
MSPRPVLLVEDHDDTREALQTLLEREGLDVVTATNGREAMAQLRDGVAPGLIILDLYMPDMDGVAFRRAQLADPTSAGVPVVLLSNGRELGFVARQLGIGLHLPKTEVGALPALALEHCTS